VTARSAPHETYLEEMLPALALALVALQAPPPGEAERRAAVEARADMDLSDVWERYLQHRAPDQTFLDFAQRRFRRKLGLGIGLTAGGALLGGLGLGLLLRTTSREGVSDDVVLADTLGSTFLLTVGAAICIPGSIILAINAARLSKLRRAGLVAGGPRWGLALAPGGVRLAF